MLIYMGVQRRHFEKMREKDDSRPDVKAKEKAVNEATAAARHSRPCSPSIAAYGQGAVGGFRRHVELAGAILATPKRG